MTDEYLGDTGASLSRPGSRPFGLEPAAQSQPEALIPRAFPWTSGPWRWEVNRSSRRVELCGGPPKRGFGRYDLTVMSFRRWGLQSAAPVFWHWDAGEWAGRPQRADELAVTQEGREHHERWFRILTHPDAKLIQAAPTLADALAGVLDLFGGYCCPEIDAAILAMQEAGYDRWSMQAQIEESDWYPGRDSDGSGEAGETGTGSTEGDSAGRQASPEDTNHDH